MPHLKYLSYVLRHKWFVFIECCKLGIPWRGLVHDLSKFLPSEFFPYAKFFYGGRKDKGSFDFAWLLHQKRNKHHWQFWLLNEDSSSPEFTLQEPGQGYEIYLSRYNRHVAMFDESILFPEDKTAEPNYCNDNAYRLAKEISDRLNREPKALQMPLEYTKEMFADWRGAGRAITGKDNTSSWYKANKDKMLLHPETREWVENMLGMKGA